MIDKQYALKIDWNVKKQLEEEQIRNKERLKIYYEAVKN